MEALLERMQKQGQGRGFLTSCEAELQELMKQIDIMVAHKKAEWESQTQALESCLYIREQELSSLRNTLDEKCKEMERLSQRLEGVEQVNRGITMEYEQQLKQVQEELVRLKRSYEKLQKKQLKETRQASKSHGEDQSEVRNLTKKLEEFRQKSLDWEKQRLRYQQHVASLEAQRKTFTEQSELIQTQLSNRKQMFESVELASQSEIHHLTSKLERANDTICANELEMERLNMRVDYLTDSNQKILEEKHRIQEELNISRNSLEVLREEKVELRATLLSQEDFINSLKLQHEQLQKEISRLTETLHTKDALIRSSQILSDFSNEPKLVLTNSPASHLREEKQTIDTLLCFRGTSSASEVQHNSGDEPVVPNLELRKGNGVHCCCTVLHTQQNREECSPDNYSEQMSLEERLQNSEGIKDLQLDHAEGTLLENSVGSANTKCLHLCEELTEKCHKLRLVEEHLCQTKSEIKKLKEQLFYMEQSHNSELEGMKQEVSLLTRELHQRDIIIASANGSTLGLEQQRKTEIERVEQKTREHRVFLTQLEALRQENQHLSEMLQKAKDTPLAELQENYTKALNEVESENQRLQKELAETQASLEASSRVSQDMYESIVQHRMIENKNTESRRIQEMQCKYEEEMRALRARFDRTVQHYEEELQKAQHLSAKRVPVSSTAARLSPRISRSNSVESLSYDPLLRLDSLPNRNDEFTCDVSRESIIRDEREILPLCPLPSANIGAIAAKFLEEEEVRSQHILKRLDAHIEELKRESEKTVQQFTHQK